MPSETLVKVFDQVNCNVCNDGMLIDPFSGSGAFKIIDVNKSTGPNSVSAFLLRFAEELAAAWPSSSVLLQLLAPLTAVR